MRGAQPVCPRRDAGMQAAMHAHAHGHEAHDHGHHHAHGPGHVHAPATFGRAFALGLALNVGYVAVEAGYGWASGSLALVADAGHNLGDVLGLAVAWAAQIASRTRPTARYTYGLRRASILSALGNAVTLLVVTGAIAWEAVRRLLHPEPTAGLVVIVVALVGVAVNGLSAALFASGRRGDLNVRGAFLHMASDALVSLGVAGAGAVILATGWLWLDPATTLVVGAVIVAGSWSLLKDALTLALDAVPPGVDAKAVHAHLADLPGVIEVHDLHIWAMSTTDTALTAHLVRPGAAPDDALLARAAEELRRRFGIGHATLQVECGDAAEPCAQAEAHAV